MLILPLHKPLNRQNFPLATALLIAVNVLVFMLLQSGDQGVRQRAIAHYQQSELYEIEMPAYQGWLSERGMGQLAESEDEQERGRWQRFMALQNDEEFLQALRADRVITADHPNFARWKRGRSEFDRQWQSSVTDQWLMRYSQVEPLRMFSAMFLHGDWGHLIGNMLFLGILGLLVEGALGGGLFLALYLLGGLGGQLFSLYWRWGEVGGLLGASGAIAALMGAFCVLWGMRRVRFFYWFLVVFDYVRAPALWLLVPWLGWELSSMLFNPEAAIGFDAHAGGIMAGALLATGVRWKGWQRDEFMDAELQQEASSHMRQRAADLFGQLEFAQALALYDQLALNHPDDVEIIVARYRAARYAPQATEIDRTAAAVLMLKGPASVLDQQMAVWEDYMQAKGRRPKIPLGTLTHYIGRLIEGNRVESADPLLSVLTRSAQPPVATIALALALVRQPELATDNPCRKRWLSWLQNQRLDPDAAEKARMIEHLERQQ